MTKNEERTVCRTPTKGRAGATRIPSWKYDAVSAVIRDAVRDAGDGGMLFSDLRGAVSDRLSADQKDTLGSMGWHVTTVKLEMEVRGEITRLPGSPQRLGLKY